MQNFKKQMNAAIDTFSELSGISREEIIDECKKDSSTIKDTVQMIMFAAR